MRIRSIQVVEPVNPRKTGNIRMGTDLDACATPGGADLEPRLVDGESVGTSLVDEVYSHHELGRRWWPEISVSDAFQIQLVPAMRTLFTTGLPFVPIFDPVAERIDS